MTRPFIAKLPGLDFDQLTLSRPGRATDAEGKPTKALSVVYAGPGTYGSGTVADRQVAAQAGQSVNAVVATTFAGAKVGDIADIRGQRYEVVGVQGVRLHYRLFLRRVDG